MITHAHELEHHGIKGMHWGIRRFQNKDGSLTSVGLERYGVNEIKSKMRENPDGSLTYSRGYTFNRVGQQSLDVNSSGGLYVSSGKEDAARYIKNLGPTKLNKFFGTSGDYLQHISVTDTLKVPSHKQVADETIRALQENSKISGALSNSIYGYLINNGSKISSDFLKRAATNSEGKEGQQLAYAVSSFLGDPNYTKESKIVYEYFRKAGYDALPDIHDRLSGTSNSAMIIINTDKVKIANSTPITEEVLREAKKQVKRMEKLKVSELLK
nr:MAG TPA: hypothetical protein [Caudoviricetes sp.]